MQDRMLVLIKPDAVRRKLIGKIVAEYERNDLEITEMKMMTAPEELVEKHYDKLRDKPFFEELVTYLSSGPLVVLVIEGKDCIEQVRKLNGATNPEEANENTIRGMYGISLTENTVHASDSQKNAEKEIDLWLNRN